MEAETEVVILRDSVWALGYAQAHAHYANFSSHYAMLICS